MSTLFEDVRDSPEASHCETPDRLFRILDEEFHFEIDVCATATNAKCATFYSATDDGLSQAWRGVCWCNPPFNKTKGEWVAKAYRESQNGNTVVVLLPWNGTGDTSWWHKYALRAAEIRYIEGRQTFDRGSLGKVTLRVVVLVFKANYSGPCIAKTFAA